MTSLVSETVETLTAHSKPVTRNPWLFSLNGIGLMFSGMALRHRDLGVDRFVRMHWFAIMFVPIIPLGIYLLSHPLDEMGREKKRLYFIHRAVSLKGVGAIWGPGGLLKLLFSGWLFGLLVVLAVAAMVALLLRA